MAAVYQDISILINSGPMNVFVNIIGDIALCASCCNCNQSTKIEEEKDTISVFQPKQIHFSSNFANT